MGYMETTTKESVMIVVTARQRKFDEAGRKYRRIWNRAYNLSEQGYDEKATKMLAKANADFAAARAEFEAAGGVERI